LGKSKININNTGGHSNYRDCYRGNLVVFGPLQLIFCAGISIRRKNTFTNSPLVPAVWGLMVCRFQFCSNLDDSFGRGASRCRFRPSGVDEVSSRKENQQRGESPAAENVLRLFFQGTNVLY
jgi:hypothetical protein